MDWISFRHRKISRSGATQHAPRAVQNAATYLSRTAAASYVETEHMPDAQVGDVSAVRAWIRDHEKRLEQDKRNARIAEVLTISLPRETTPDERIELSRNIRHSLTLGKAPSIFGIHDWAKNDADNPHLHMMVFDRDVKTGKRVFGFSNRGSTKRAREAVVGAVNAWYEATGRETRIDPRSFKERGLGKEPTLHVGPGVKKMAERGDPVPASSDKVVGRRNGKGLRAIRYTEIDATDEGEMSRMRANELTRELNEQRKKARRYEKELARLREAYERAMGMIGRAARLLGVRTKEVKLSELDKHLSERERAGAGSDTTPTRGNDAPGRQRENDDAMEAELQAVMDQTGFEHSRGNSRGRARSR